MSNIIPFTYEQNEFRTLTIDGDIWFVAADVCKMLDIIDVKQAIERLDDDERGTYTVPSPGGNQMTNCINESGLYMLIFTSRKPEAKKFRRWVTSEVLPSIRKTGKYAPEKRVYITSNRGEITPEQEKELVFQYVHHIWYNCGVAASASHVSSFVKRLDTDVITRWGNELVAEGRLDSFRTPHTLKFRPNDYDRRHILGGASRRRSS